MITKSPFNASLFGLLLVAVIIGSASAAQSPVTMGSTANFSVLAATAVTNTGSTVIAEDLGLSPNDNSSITGFLVVDGGPGVVVGDIHAADAVAAQAQADLTTAYNDAAGRTTDVVIIPSGELGGLTLTPGLYRSGVSSFDISAGTLTLDAQGNASAVFIFQMPSSTLTTISGTDVILTGNASACNVFWQVGSSATLGTGSTFKGNILAMSSITLTTGAVLEGKALARTGAVTLDTNSVSLTCITPSLPNSTNTTNTTIPGPTNETNTTIPGPTNQTNTTQPPIQNQTNTTQPPQNTTNQTDACYSWLKDIPAVCIGGTITLNTDLVTFDNCRHVVCVNGSNSLAILACEKPDEINPTYFEMYKEGQTGSGIQICLGSACIEHNGFASQQFPVCTNGAGTNTTVNATTNATNPTVNLFVKEWYPKDDDFVFVCEATGFTPTLYDWFYGNGHKLIDVTNGDTYHDYTSPGTYTVSCTAKDGATTASDSMSITVV